jgi:hypothetical protein
MKKNIMNKSEKRANLWILFNFKKINHKVENNQLEKYQQENNLINYKVKKTKKALKIYLFLP